MSKTPALVVTKVDREQGIVTMSGLNAWLPEDKAPDAIRTYKAADGQWYDPNDLEAYFKSPPDDLFWGVNRSSYQQMVLKHPSASAALKLGMQTIADAIAKDLYGVPE